MRSRLHILNIPNMVIINCEDRESRSRKENVGFDATINFHRKSTSHNIQSIVLEVWQLLTQKCPRALHKANKPQVSHERIENLKRGHFAMGSITEKLVSEVTLQHFSDNTKFLNKRFIYSNQPGWAKEGSNC